MSSVCATSDIEIDDESLSEIYSWIDQITFSRAKKNISRDFSDGVLMAELLKKYYPRLVDMHNYISGNSIVKKIDNWCTLNRKVLSKLNLKLGKDVIDQLANSQPGVIEKVLADLRNKIIKDCTQDRDSLYLDYGDTSKGETIPNTPQELTNRTVPRQIFLRLKREMEEKNELINTLSEKVSHLSSLIKLKDQRITDLTVQITRNPQ